MSAVQQQQFDASRAEAFGGRMVGIVNDASLALMISLGHRTGALEAMAGLDWAGIDAIADASNLHPRYVREWLGAMVTGGVVEFDPETQRYRLPAEHAAVITSKAGSHNLAVPMQFIPVMGSVETQLVDAFRHGGGVPYSEFERFHPVMADFSDQTVLAGLENSIIPAVPGLHERLQSGIDCVDIGCGSGHAAIRMAELYPNSRFTGYDFEERAVNAANELARSRGIGNISFEVRDVADMDETESFDLVTAFDVIHDQADPAGVLANVRRMLRSGGVFLMQDIKACSQLHDNIDHMVGTFLYTVSTTHCMTVSLANGGAGLGTCWGRELAERMIGDAGFSSLDTKELSHDPFNYYYIMHV
ncbi:MAG: class I SAM-dependent methyltransferase [bacterium]